MDSQDVSVAIATGHLPFLVWLLSGVICSLTKTFIEKFDDNKKSTTAATKTTTLGPVKNIFVVFFADVALVCIETSLHILRICVSFLPLFLFFWVTVFISVIVLERGPNVIFVVDTTYEAIRPMIIETVLQVLNFVRTLYALTVGIWNALIDLAMVPVRLLFDSAFKCGGSDFILAVASRGSDVVREFASVMYVFFSKWKEQNILETDVTGMIAAFRTFGQAFTDVIECSCETIAVPTTRAVVYPLFTNRTDVFINNATRAVLKTIEIPYAAMMTGTVSFEPLFHIILAEDTGVLASGALLGNDYFQAIVQVVQSLIPPEGRFNAPPIFSLLHRYIAMMVEGLNILVQTISAVPTLVGQQSGLEKTNTLHSVASSAELKFHFNTFADVLCVDCFSVLHHTWKDYGSLFATAAHGLAETAELVFNFTLDAAAGIQQNNFRVSQVRNNNNVGTECTTSIVYSDDPGIRIKVALFAVADRYSFSIVPLQIQWLASLRNVLDKNLLSTALAESVYVEGLFVVRWAESWIQIGSYLTDALLRFQPVSSSCIQNFQAAAWDKLDDTLTSLPNLLTSILNIEETNDSGYSNLVCARTTHVNHVYSGSLKSYVFAAHACRARYEGTNIIPKCSYRDESNAAQALLCEKLTAFADYNTNPLCNTGDVLIEGVKSLMLALRTVNEYQLGMIVGIWNCIADASTLDFASCGSKLSGEFVPSEAVFDLLECQVNELVYRTAVVLVSVWTPLFEAVYIKTGYPSNGYYASGADDLMHVQARPLEAGFATRMTALGGIFTYPVHVFAECGRDLSVMFKALVSGTFDPTAFFSYHFKIQVSILRAIILFTRDLLIGLVQFARTADTVSYYQQQTGQKDPKATTDTFKDFQKAIGEIVGLIQDIAELLTDSFIKGIELFFDLFFSLMHGLLNADGASIGQAFEKFVNAIMHVLVDMIEGVFKTIIQPFEGGFINPFRFLFCDVLGAMKDGTCSFMQFNFIPYQFKLGCVGRAEGCAFLPGGKIAFFNPKSGTSTMHEAVGASVQMNSYADAGASYLAAFQASMGSGGIAQNEEDAWIRPGFNWNDYFGYFDPSWSMFGRGNYLKEDVNAYAPEKFCEYIDNPTMCHDLDKVTITSFADEISTQAYWANKKGQCDAPRKCSSYAADGGCRAYINACVWVAGEESSYINGDFMEVAKYWPNDPSSRRVPHTIPTGVKNSLRWLKISLRDTPDISDEFFTDISAVENLIPNATIKGLFKRIVVERAMWRNKPEKI